MNELNNIMENANPLEFFQFLIGNNNELGDFLSDIKARVKVEFDELPIFNTNVEENCIDDIVSRIHNLENTFKLVG